MNPLLAQAAPAPDPTPATGAASGAGGIQVILPSVDWSTLIPQILGYFTNAIGTWLTDTSHKTLDSLWSGDHDILFQTPQALTWSFGPVHAQLADVQTGARAVLIFALVLLGLRGMLGALIDLDLLGEFARGVLSAVILLAAFPIVIPMVIDLLNQAAGAVAGSAGLSSYVSAGGNGFSDPLVSGILFLILAFFAVRLLIKSIWRIGFLAVLLPVGPVACALYALPQTRWLLTWWARVWGGMLLAQIPSVFALSVGLGMFAGGGGGIGSVVWSIAFLQLATDLYSVIPFGSLEHHGSPLVAALAGARAALVGAGVAGKLAGSAASGATLSTREAGNLYESHYGYR